MATERQLTVAKLNNAINNPYIQEQFRKALGENAGAFATSLMEVATSDEKLLACDPNELTKEAIKAATLKLPVNKQLGFCYLVPYGKVPTLIIGYKGYLQLAARTGQYKVINTDIVYEGELQSVDRLTGMIKFNNDISARSTKVAGYFAYFEMNNGYTKTVYMSLADMAKYAKRYSPTCKDTDPKKLMELAQKQADDGVAGNGVGWFADFNSMACKTVLRRLLSKYGILSTEMVQAYNNERNAEEAAYGMREEANTEEDKPIVVNEAPAGVNPETGEVNEAAPVQTEASPI